MLRFDLSGLAQAMSAGAQITRVQLVLTVDQVPRNPTNESSFLLQRLTKI